MNNRIKEIVAIIKKEAQFAQLSKPGTPASTTTNESNYGGAESIMGGAPANKGPSKPGTGVGKGIVVNESVKNMQLAMQDLAQNVIQDSESSTMSLKSRDTEHTQATDAVKKSKKAFNDFIAEQYIGSLSDDMKGVEWTKNQKVTTHPDKSKTQTDIYELDVVMNTLKRIGAERSEFKVDGNWDWRTDNALNNILGFAYALLQLEGDFGLNNTVYNSSNWAEFKKLLSGYTVEGNNVGLTPEQKTNRAKRITKHLQAISKLYSLFRQQVIARPEFRPYIEGKRSFDKYDQQGSNKDVLTPNESQMAQSDTANISGITYMAPKLPGKKLTYIPLKALTSKEEYLKWMLDYAGVPNEDMAIRIFNGVIKPKIEAL